MTTPDNTRKGDSREGQVPPWPVSENDPARRGSRPSQFSEGVTMPDSDTLRGQGGTWPSREYPSHGVRHVFGEPTIVFVTVCTKNRHPWLASESIHQLLRSAWSNAPAWLVGRYVIMPDHVHLFVAPGETGIDLTRWIRYWKTSLSRRLDDPAHRWQKDYWDARMRSHRTYQEKWDYVRDNPVRHRLVTHADDWPYQGELYALPW